MKIQSQTCKLFDVRPNLYNYNVMDNFIFAKEVNSIRKLGFIDPITVRSSSEVEQHELEMLAARFDGLLDATLMASAPLEITDGEHRLRALLVLRQRLLTGEYTAPTDLEYDDDVGELVHPDGSVIADTEICSDTVEILQGGKVLPVSNLGECSWKQASRMTVLLNEIKGSPDYAALGELLRSWEGDSESLAKDLPYTSSHITALLEDTTELSLDELFKDEPGEESPGSDPAEGWVHVTVVMPQEAHEVFTSAKAKVVEELTSEGHSVNEREDLANGQAIELLSAEYLAK